MPSCNKASSWGGERCPALANLTYALLASSAGGERGFTLLRRRKRSSTVNGAPPPFSHLCIALPTRYPAQPAFCLSLQFCIWVLITERLGLYSLTYTHAIGRREIAAVGMSENDDSTLPLVAGREILRHGSRAARQAQAWSSLKHMGLGL